MKKMIIGRGKVLPWTTDPSLASSYSAFVFVPPRGLASFASSDLADHIRVIHGPKGSGKTSVLLAKIQAVEELAKEKPRSIISIPSRPPYIFLPPELANRIPFESWATIKSYEDERTWVALWVLIFGAYVFAALEQERRGTESIERGAQRTSSAAATAGSVEHNAGAGDTLLPKALGDFLIPNYSAANDIGSISPAEELVRILRRVIVDKKAGRSHLQGLFDEHLRSRIESLARPERERTIFIFVDAVDEIFGGRGTDASLLAMVQKKNADSADEPLTPQEAALVRKFWSYAQSSLLSASFDLGQMSAHAVRLIASMRTEAYNFASHTKGDGQLMSMVQEVSYGRTHLQAIIEANIEHCDKSSLAQPSAPDSITRFFGFSEVAHWKTGESEPVLDWILRHTMEEPRDLMVAFGKFAKLDPVDRADLDQTAKALHSASAVILKDYLNFLATPWDLAIEKLVLPSIASNIIRVDEVEEIAQAAEQQSHGQVKHPFCYLYGLGLIGVPVPGGHGRIVQEFALPARFPDQDDHLGSLPEATHYFIHPMLSDRIKEIRRREKLSTFVTHGATIVGHGRGFELDIDATRIVVGVKRNDGRKPFATVRIDGKDLGYDPANADLTNRFADFGNIETVLFFSLLYTLAKRSASDPVNLTISMDELKDCIEFLIDHGLVPKIVHQRVDAVGVYEKIEKEFQTYAWDNKKYPKSVQRINSRLTYWLAEGLRLSVQSNRSITLCGDIRATDISIGPFSH